ncbi:hypothetical protein HG531_007575 [Fusarium graminearum]|nr:hypothetical protein HG531_007575 [Fusarium graminearum]
MLVEDGSDITQHAQALTTLVITAKNPCLTAIAPHLFDQSDVFLASGKIFTSEKRIVDQQNTAARSHGTVVDGFFDDRGTVPRASVVQL